MRPATFVVRADGQRVPVSSLSIGDKLAAPGARRPLEVVFVARGTADRWVRLEPENGSPLFLPGGHWVPFVLGGALVYERAADLLNRGVDAAGAIRGVQLVYVMRDGPDPTPIGPALLARVRASVFVEEAAPWAWPIVENRGHVIVDPRDPKVALKSTALQGLVS